MTDLRDLIARAIFLVDYMSMGEESWETAALDGNDDRNQAFEKADAVLAVLADLPDDVIEQAAGRFRELVLKCGCIRCENVAADHVKNTFAAVFGGERA